jgi:hypothetical protein
MQAAPAQRLAVVEALDREQKAAMDARIPERDQARAGRRRAGRRARALFPDDEGADAARLLLVGDRLHEGDCSTASRGAVDPCAPLARGDKSWAHTPDPAFVGGTVGRPVCVMNDAQRS